MNLIDTILKKAFIFLAALSTFASTPSLYAKTYYVDFMKGFDSNNGTSTSTPFKHCPGDDNATGAAGSTTLSAGDKVIFRGGVEYNGRIDLDWDGTGDPDSQRIIYDGDSGTYVSQWGSSMAIIDGQNTRGYGFYSSTDVDYVTINYFEIREHTTSNIEFGSSGADSSNPEITNCYIHSITNYSSVGGQSNNGIRLTRPNGGQIDNNIIEKPRYRGIALGGARNIVVSNNTIDDYWVWGIDIYRHGQAHQNVTIKSNTLIDGWRFDALGPHSDYIFVRQGSPMTGAEAGLNTIVERNLLYNNTTFSDFGGTAMITVARCKNVTVRNNVIINPHSYYAMQLGWEGWESGHRVYNNTVYAPRGGCDSLRISDSVSADVRNNIFVGGSQCIDNYGYPGSLRICDYNLYYHGYTNAWNDGTGNYNWTNWTTTQGWDSNGYEYTDLGDIKFIDTFGYPTDCGSMDLRLQSNSPAVDAGITLTGFSVDKDGVPRPQGSAWDMGAYEFVEGGGDSTPPSPPSGIEVID